MASDTLIDVPIEQLQLNVENWRYEGAQQNQRECMRRIAQDQGIKLARLAEDITKRGMNPSENLIVRRGRTRDQYIVLDGNRRMTALKLITEPTLLQSLNLAPNLSSKLRKIGGTVGTDFITTVRCVVLSPEDARHWLLMKHSPVRDGVATEPWDTLARQRFRGMTPQLQAVDLVMESDYVSESLKGRRDEVPLSHIQRILETRVSN